MMFQTVFFTVEAGNLQKYAVKKLHYVGKQLFNYVRVFHICMYSCLCTRSSFLLYYCTGAVLFSAK